LKFQVPCSKVLAKFTIHRNRLRFAVYERTFLSKFAKSTISFEKACLPEETVCAFLQTNQIEARENLDTSTKVLYKDYWIWYNLSSTGAHAPNILQNWKEKT
jgi:hypothetical protein